MRPQTYVGLAGNERACHDRANRMTWTSQTLLAYNPTEMQGCVKQLLLTFNSQHFENQCTRAEMSQAEVCKYTY